MNRGKNSLVSRASQPISTSTRTCARVRLGELFSPCDSRDSRGERVSPAVTVRPCPEVIE